MVKSNVDDLGDWNKDSIQLLAQALEFKLRVLIHKVHFHQFTNTGNQITRQFKKGKTSATKKTYKKSSAKTKKDTSK